ncbi:MAG: ankyrin repeat domain-containing protein [Rhizobiaceae bacterium]
MKNKKVMFAAIVGIVFLFAGYNLYSYFKTQQAIQVEEDRVAEERRIERDQERQTREAEAQAQQERAEAERAAERAAEEQRREDEAARREEARIAEEARQAVADARAEEERLAQEEERMQARILKARTLRQIEGIWSDTVEELNSVSPRYITDHPDEFLTQTFTAVNLGAQRSSMKLMVDDSNPLMLYAAISSDIRILQALLDIGIDINAANEKGYTALMFASAYNSPEVIEFLIGQGADISAQAYVMDLNVLHIAALFNPNPDSAEALIHAGLPLEGKTSNDYTALLLAASDNTNLEVVERLAQLGADLGVYDQGGTDAQGIVRNRIQGDGDLYTSVTPEFNERVLMSLGDAQ